jgi:hypothetical protein
MKHLVRSWVTMRRILFVVAFLVSGSGVAGCRPDPIPCSSNVTRGDRFEVTVVGTTTGPRARAAGLWLNLPSCALADVHVGERFTITLESPRQLAESGCRSFECPDDFPTEGSPSMGYLSTVSNNYICLNTSAKADLGNGCALARYVALAGGDPGSVGEEQPDPQPDGETDFPFVLVRGLGGEPNVICPDFEQQFPGASRTPGLRCMDAWGVSIRKL